MVSRFYIPFLLLTAIPAASALADWRSDVRFDTLQEILRQHTPRGANVRVAQVEVASVTSDINGDGLSDSGQYKFTPDPANEEFAGKTFDIIDLVTPFDPAAPNALPSGHATGVVGIPFYGNNSSIASQVTNIQSFGISDVGIGLPGNYLENGYIRFGVAGLPRTSSPLDDLANDSPPSPRVYSHGWVGKFSSNVGNIETLARLDWTIQYDHAVHIAGIPNGRGQASDPLMGAALNVISVGLTSGEHRIGTNLTGASPYAPSRNAPHIVVPFGSTSSGTGFLSGAATALVGYMHQNPSLSNGSLTSRDQQTVYHGETNLVIKAALLAGANRNAITEAENSDTYQLNTTNNLNNRYGAGQLDITTSLLILAAGERDGTSSPSPSRRSVRGWDYHPGLEGGESAHYRITVPNDGEFTATLAWNAHVDIFGVAGSFGSLIDDEIELNNFDLFLYRESDDTLVASSQSTDRNTENLYIPELPADNYRLQVLSTDPEADPWEFGLAWQSLRDPIAGDADLDGDVDGFDFLIWQSNFGTPDDVSFLEADFDLDGDIDADDFALLTANFGFGLQDFIPGALPVITVTPGQTPVIPPNHPSNSISSIPEPATSLLLTLTATLLIRRHPA